MGRPVYRQFAEDLRGQIDPGGRALARLRSEPKPGRRRPGQHGGAGGPRLRALRDLTVKQAARPMSWSASKFTRLESGGCPASLRDVRDPEAACVGSRTGRDFAAARQAPDPGRGSHDDEPVLCPYIGSERQAAAILRASAHPLGPASQDERGRRSRPIRPGAGGPVQPCNAPPLPGDLS
jgi:hypothetical protein